MKERLFYERFVPINLDIYTCIQRNYKKKYVKVQKRQSLNNEHECTTKQ